jgi:hypothetical protein
MIARLAFVGISLAALAAPVAAQQTQFDVHGNLAIGTSSHLKSWGGGVGIQATFGGASAPLQLSLSPSADMIKQEKGGPRQTTLSLDVNVQPGGNSTVTPYAGVSAGANWSAGTTAQWEGARLGLETLGGITAKLGQSLSLKAEERFGYVKGQEHTLTTRVGVLFSP